MRGLATSFRHLAKAAILVAAFAALSPAVARAETPFTMESCNSGLGLRFEAWEYTSMVVGCLKGTVVSTTGEFLEAFSVYMTRTVAIMMVFAIAIFGMRIMNGEEDLKKRAVGFLLRLGLVWFFSYKLGGFAYALFDVMDELVCLVSIPDFGSVNSGCYPWNFMDHFIGRLFGFGERLFLYNGLIGIISGALFSSVMGILVFLTGLMALLDLLFLILRVIFVYLSAVLALAFLIILSPFIIPMTLFYNTERYFNRWLDTMLTALITPMLLFAFLGLFLGVYDIMIDRIIDILSPLDAEGRPHFDAYWRMNQPKLSWLMPSDPNLSERLQDVTGAAGPGSPAVQSFINPLGRWAMNAGSINTPGIDFGAATVQIMQQLVLAFISFWIFSTLLKSMVQKIPEIAQNIGQATLGIGYNRLSIETTAREAVRGGREAAKEELTNAALPQGRRR